MSDHIIGRNMLQDPSDPQSIGYNMMPSLPDSFTMPGFSEPPATRPLYIPHTTLQEIDDLHTNAITVDLIHTVMTMATLLRERTIAAPVVQTALYDLASFEDFDWLLEKASEAAANAATRAQNTHQE